MRTQPVLAAVAATGLLLVGGTSALALGHGGSGDDPPPAARERAHPAGPVGSASVVPPELPLGPAPAPDAAAGVSAPAAVPVPAAPVPTGSVPAAPAPARSGPVIDRAAAERIALAAAGGGRVTDVELDRADDPGEPDRWEIEVDDRGTEHEIELHAGTGAILEHDVDRA